MLVKKLNPEWCPSENPNLAVGETVEITDPKQLILNGDAVALSSNGEELSAYELYGVILPKDQKEFEEWLQIKKATAMRDQLMKEKEMLEQQIAANPTAAQIATGGVSATATEAADNDINAKRLAALAKARAARAANRKK